MKFNKVFSILALAFTSMLFTSVGYGADGQFNVSKGRINELHNNVVNNTPANSGLVVMLFQAAEADATLEDYANAATLIAAPGNTEATFTGYFRKILTDADLTATTVDNGSNIQWADLPDQVWTNAGGSLDNTLSKFKVFYDDDVTAGTDADLLPLTHMDFPATTNGNDLTAVVPANGYFSAN